MFHNIPKSILVRMEYLESIDARDRRDGTPRLERLRQIPPETGRFLAIMAASAPSGDWLEIGTSAGYSSLWISLACALRNQKLITYEILEDKARLARQTFESAKVQKEIELVHGDARQLISSHTQVAFCFIDAEKEIYQACYDLLAPRMVSGGLILADNAINHRQTLEPMLEYALADKRFDSLIVPIGKGVLLCRKI